MDHDFNPALPETFTDFADRFDAMASAAVVRFTYSPDRPDVTFGRHGEVAALVRSATTLEGGLIEQGLATLLGSDPRFQLVSPVLKLPILDEAVAAVKANDFSALAKVRFDPKAYAASSYTPDLIVVDRANQIAHMLELKRSSGSFGTGYLTRLEKKMQAATLVLPHVLFYQNYPVITDVNMVIVDCDDTDPREQVVGLRDLDEVLQCPGVSQALRYLRSCFGQQVQARVDECLSPQTGTVGAADKKPTTWTQVGDALAPTRAGHDQLPPNLGDVTVTIGRKRGRPKKASHRATEMASTVAASAQSEGAEVKRGARAKSMSTAKGASFPGSISMGTIDPTTPGDDPAAIIGLAVRMGLMGQVDRTGLPSELRDALRNLAADGEPAAAVVLEWLDGVLLSKISNEIGNA